MATCRPGRIAGSYSYIWPDIHDHGTDLALDHPSQQAKLQTHLNLTKHWELNAATYVANTASDVAKDRDYFRLDLGLTWHVSEHAELSAWGMNLLDPHHFEDAEPFLLSNLSEVPRSFYVQFSLRF